MDQQRYAFFDLDHTLLPFDTQALFCNHILRREPWRILYLLVFLPVIPFAALKLVGSRTLKRVFMAYLWRMDIERLRSHVSSFVSQTVSPWIYPELQEEIARHRREGRTLVLTTASPDTYARAIGDMLGFDHTFATKLAPATHRMPLFPDILGPNNKRSAKIAHMAEAGILPHGFDPADPYPIPGSHAYTDSAADLPLLAIAEHGHLVHPDPDLASLGRSNAWQTHLPTRPYHSKSGDIFASLLQALGLYRKISHPDPPAR